ncbi:lysylphosphatidylglycerol synthase transmembrane domain-containing protein [Labedaea rhizosphaerae]|uniref:lysylphosphatidylglycerol synthase transmembrane domain-containing protein n=1 Tax=Labedaea rhizosphaerae TaxID=598644 RepID=UPI001414CF0A|nr:lysylphosphatidylglycerol synthase transmembrane domain-containing protein [Labedaea rhizosphaerae]
MGIAAIFTVSGKLPSMDAVVAALHDADTDWLVVAAAAELFSMAMFARQQRRLLLAFDVKMPRHRAIALAYSRSALAISMPAGSAVSAAYAFRWFRADGASRSIAATVMVLSGLISFVALGLLSLTGGAAAVAMRVAEVWRTHQLTVQLSVAAALVLIPLIVHLARHSSTKMRVRLPEVLRTAITDAREVAPRHWALALGAAGANWLTDLLCLAAAAAAFHLPVTLWQLGAVYLAVQLVRQIPLTPGGIGVIEASLLAGLVAAGAAAGPAAAVVLVYRVLSCWLVLPAGVIGWLVLRTGHPVTADTPRVGVPV